jgi:hypothetical protein
MKVNDGSVSLTRSDEDSGHERRRIERKNIVKNKGYNERTRRVDESYK